LPRRIHSRWTIFGIAITHTRKLLRRMGNLTIGMIGVMKLRNHVDAILVMKAVLKTKFYIRN